MEKPRCSLVVNLFGAATLGLIATTGFCHAAATVVVWGWNSSGQITVPTGLTNVVAIAAGDNFSMALTTDGWVFGWGRNDNGQTTIPSGLSNVVAIAAGTYHSLALTAEGRVVGWGSNGYGQTTIPTSGISNVVAIAAGDYHSLALTATPVRWHVFTGWTDGATNNSRLVTIGESNRYTAVFTPITPLETVTIGNVTRLAPVGMPAVLVDGTFFFAESISVRGSAQITVSTTFPNGTLRYTLDGSNPATAATLYTGPFSVAKTSRLRAIAYNADFTQSVAGDSLDIVILPTLTGLTEGGGSVGIEPVAGAYFSNDLALVTATANPGWTFLHWLGDATGTNPTVSVAMTRNKSVRAVFGTPLSTTVVGGGSTVVSPVSAWQPYGNQVRLTAVPTTGNYLAFWANAASGQTNNPLTFTVTNENLTVTAVFASLSGTVLYFLC